MMCRLSCVNFQIFHNFYAGIKCECENYFEFIICQLIRKIILFSYQFTARVINTSPVTQMKLGERTFSQAHVDLLDEAGTIIRCQASGDSLCCKIQDDFKVMPFDLFFKCLIIII